ncbi:hypothetical protein [Pseudostreptobacillus hongkongensis]|uniref:hypothetical protein n=1 Tax=Pseudostreptobacillus hongkongensis TaxID=1162717 RepID=UPI0014705A5F|nr:hypothetical protein [Pseudostreptobacillus hongkongensis]
MKKVLFGMIALTSVISLADNFNGNLEVTTTGSVQNGYTSNGFNHKGVPSTSKLFKETKLQAYFTDSNDVSVFVGTKGDVLKKDFGKNLVFDAFGNYYVGMRVDSKVSEDFDLTVNLGTKHGYTKTLKNVNNKIVESKFILEDAIVAHLKAKNKFDSKRYFNKDEKVGYLEENGYKLHKPEHTLVFGVVTHGKVDKVNLIGGLNYSSKNFEDATVESFVKLNGNINDNMKASGFVRNLLDSTNYKSLGKLKVNGKLETMLNKDLKLTNLGEVELDTILSKENAENVKDTRTINLKVENGAVYTGIENLKLTGDLNYKLGINSQVLSQDITEATKTYKGNKGDMTHTPELKVGAEYMMGDFKFTTKNKAKYTYKHMLGQVLKNTTPLSATLENTVAVMSENKAEYKYDKFNVAFNLDYHLDVFGKNNKLEKNKHWVVLGPTVNYSDNMLKSELGLRYVLQKTGTELLFHRQFGWLKNSLTTKFMDTDIVASANIYDYYKYSKNPNFAVFADLGVKATNHSIDKFSNMADLNVKYGYVDLNTDATLVLKKQGINASLNLESKYNYDKNIDIIGGFKTEYRYNDLGNDLYKAFTDYIINVTRIDDNYYPQIIDYRNNIKDEKFRDKVIAQANNLKNANDQHDLVLTPSLGTSIRFVDGRLEVGPKLEGIFKFNKKNGVNNSFFNSAEGKLSLNLKYRW